MGDYGKVYRKKDMIDKERMREWSENKYQVEENKEEKDPLFDYMSGQDGPLLRNEILLVKS